MPAARTRCRARRSPRSARPAACGAAGSVSSVVGAAGSMRQAFRVSSVHSRAGRGRTHLIRIGGVDCSRRRRRAGCLEQPQHHARDAHRHGTRSSLSPARSAPRPASRPPRPMTPPRAQLRRRRPDYSRVTRRHGSRHRSTHPLSTPLHTGGATGGTKISWQVHVLDGELNSSRRSNCLARPSDKHTHAAASCVPI